MKTLLTVLLLSITTTATAQFSSSVAQGYANEVYEVIQGHVEEYGSQGGSDYAIGYASEYMDFSLVRTMIGMLTNKSNVTLAQAWQRDKAGVDKYSYAVAIDGKHLMLIVYDDVTKMTVIMHNKF